MRKEAEMQDSDLDDLFATARQQPAAVSAELMARVLSDADDLQPRAEALPARKGRVGFWAGLMAAIGGAGGVVGLSTAAMAGVWIGFAQPNALTAVTDRFLPDETVSGPVDVLPGFDDFLSEG
jgi:hypothetical protein